MEELDLENIRKQIDSIDSRIIQLLGKRFKLVENVAKYKQLNNIKPLQPKRWQEVLEKIKKLGLENNLDEALVSDVWNLIHENALKKEAKIINNN